ncbi:hypothetical protein [Lacticaseibacillus mingshuiensis]|uniref:Phage protein n=1 Tax=Lacticaseibacillus mingshuiensis TaxID=2799574 RepID=A0ABW4CEC4_9LACO|nr:hypothetical protein [Lacticaseibacillus mingshuiensis]
MRLTFFEWLIAAFALIALIALIAIGAYISAIVVALLMVGAILIDRDPRNDLRGKHLI